MTPFWLGWFMWFMGGVVGWALRGLWISYKVSKWLKISDHAIAYAEREVRLPDIWNDAKATLEKARAVLEVL